MPNCSVKVDWAPMGGRDALAKTGMAEMFNFNFCNDPLVPVRQYVNVIHGLDHKRMGGDPHGGGFLRYSTGGHIQQGEATRDPGAGRLPGDGNMPKLPSIDQLLIKNSPMIGDPSLPIKTGLQLALNTRGPHRRRPLHHAQLLGCRDARRQAGGAAPGEHALPDLRPHRRAGGADHRPARRRRRW